MPGWAVSWENWNKLGPLDTEAGFCFGLADSEFNVRKSQVHTAAVSTGWSKRGFQKRTGFNVRYMSKSCRTETHWYRVKYRYIDLYLYILKKRNLSHLVTLRFRLQPQFRNLHIRINRLNWTKNSNMGACGNLRVNYTTCLHTLTLIVNSL